MDIQQLVGTAILATGGVRAHGRKSLSWTVTAYGWITRGTDQMGLFGAAGADLAGGAFTHTITVDLDPGTQANEGRACLWFTDAVTIDGGSASLNGTGHYARQGSDTEGAIHATFTGAGVECGEQLQLGAWISAADGSTSYALSHLRRGATFFHGQAEGIVINGEHVTQAHGPASIALLGAGLLGLVSRQRKQAA
jgi:hypothetical protein